MNSFSFLLIIVAMSVVIYWYVMNVEFSRDGNDGFFALVEEKELGEEVRMRELARRARFVTHGRHAAGLRRKITILNRSKGGGNTSDVQGELIVARPAFVAPAKKEAVKVQPNAIAKVRGVPFQPISMVARVEVVKEVRTARQKVQDKMLQPDSLTPSEEEAALAAFERTVGSRKPDKSISRLAKGDAHRTPTKEADIFAKRVKDMRRGIDVLADEVVAPKAYKIASSKKWQKRSSGPAYKVISE